MIRHIGNTRTHCALAIGLALALGGCSSPPTTDEGATKPEATEAKAEEVAAGRSSSLAKRATPAGLAMATLNLFEDGKLDPSQEATLIALRGRVVSAQRAIGVDILARRDADAPDLGAAMAEKQHALVDSVLVGALALRGSLSPAQRAAFGLRAKEHARAARRHAAKLAADGNDDRVALAQARADILEELARPSPDETKTRSLGSAFVTSHTRAIGASTLATIQELH